MGVQRVHDEPVDGCGELFHYGWHPTLRPEDLALPASQVVPHLFSLWTPMPLVFLC